jgi:hypothetical protein
MARSRTVTNPQTGEIYQLVKFSRCPSEYRRAYLKGWQDGIRELGYPLDYDVLSPYAQAAYEEGRLDACNVKTAGINVIWWDTVSVCPPLIERAISLAIRRIGDSQPRLRETTK